MAKKGFTEGERPTPLLRDVVISRIEPSSISEHPKFLYPSVYDMLAIDIYMPTLLLYRMDSRDPSAFSNFIHALKNSLDQVLSLYYPMAGKWIPAEDGWIRKLACNGEGAVFVEAAIDSDMDDVLPRDDFSPPEELLGEHAVPGFEVTGVYKTSEANEAPALIVQVTRFKCGGVALTLNFHHMTVDGFGFDRFLKAWSEILSTGQTSVKPVFDRSLVPSHLDKSHILGIQPDMENPDDVLSSHFRFFRSKVQFSYTGKIFSIGKDTVGRLKQKAKEEHVSDTLKRAEHAQFTTFECVSAQLWRCCARIPKSGENVVSVTFPVEGRTKWSNPPLPEDYVGNMSMLTSAGLPSSAVTDKPLSFAASHIHESVAKVNPQTSGELLDRRLTMMKMVQQQRSTEETLQETEKHNRTFELILTSWTRFDNLYNLNFGYGGPFFYSPCPGWLATSGVMVFLLAPPPKSGNEVELYIRTSSEHMNILLEDPEFMHLVS